MQMIYSVLLASFLVLFSCDSDPRSSEGYASAETPVDTIPIDPSFTLGFVMGQFDPAGHPDFVPIDVQYADRGGLYLHKDTYAAFLAMHKAAAKDGVRLVIRSAARSFDYQKGLWLRKWEGRANVDGQNLAKTMPDARQRALKILEYSAMPGSSRHHWGTDIDLNAFVNSYFEKGEGKKVYDWLQANAAKYGFCQPYTAKGPDRPNGYLEEKWHWSYLPIAVQLTELARKSLKDEMIQGFGGAEAAPAIGVVEKYVLGINEDCKALPR
jgi:D-alanyl-D-alanine carboxypeptidase